jgi:hypothetical protein
MKRWTIFTLLAVVVGSGFYLGYRHATAPRTMITIKEASRGQAELSATVEEVQQAFLSFQQLCKAKDITGILIVFDLETIAKTNEIDLQSAKNALSQQLVQKAGQGKDAPTVLDIMANAKIESVKEFHFQKGESIPINPNEPIMIVEIEIVYGEIWEVYFHKTADGWKMLSWKRIAPESG